MSGRSVLGRRTAIALLIGLATLTVSVGVVAASNVAAGLSQESGDVTIPTWLYLATGGGVIGASALMTMLVTDRAVIDDYHDRAVGLGTEQVVAAGSLLLGTLGLFGLALVIVVAGLGPDVAGFASAAVLLTFVGGRALLTTIAYVVGNPWPALNPWRRIAEVLPHGFVAEEYPRRLGSWPAVVALLALVWLEIVAPLSSSPGALLLAVLGYSAFTIGGAVAFSPATWFDRGGDPLSTWFRMYGAVAPVQRTDDGLAVRFPGARLGDDDVVTDVSAIAFVLVLVWELTYSGFIVTAPGVATIEFLVGLGLPPAFVYLALLLAGFWLFWKVYWLAAERTRDRAETYISTRYLALRFAPALLAIAAGYHFAHYAGFAITLWPSLLETLAAPLSPPANPTQYRLASWFGYVEIAGILIGHILAVWVSHTIAFELFPGKLQAIRSQYPFIVVMIFFTMVSLYLVSLPTMSPPFVAA
ncbi:hypothetical protein ACFO5R_10215 [Halosolutus amylolyticus]|uniref:Uncharacterized protein n=1 Tax=Halosolutus amylolyticus TaxID=2932267 RepID=A0ABD5PPB6_9EURY|nr:hypothetical protein [Halosolutus amylolyticus]